MAKHFNYVPGAVTIRTGTFVYLCDIFCGVGHAEMNRKVTVVE